MAAQERLAAILELRAADPQQRAILDAYLAEVAFPPAARLLAGWPGVAEAVDPSPVFVAKAGEPTAGLANVMFRSRSACSPKRPGAAPGWDHGGRRRRLRHHHRRPR